MIAKALDVKAAIAAKWVCFVLMLDISREGMQREACFGQGRKRFLYSQFDRQLTIAKMPDMSPSHAVKQDLQDARPICCVDGLKSGVVCVWGLWRRILVECPHSVSCREDEVQDESWDSTEGLSVRSPILQTPGLFVRMSG